ncbi:MAG TPA: hypothetical protein VH210_10000, partial [Gaiellaceae bacterium]|nr:hypothetical protein [Gaiellaceae bacterium]
ISGRCAAVLSNGKRCPNAALPGSKYCGVPAHQELALREPDEDNPIVAESEPELEALADLTEPDAVTEDGDAFPASDPEEEFPAGPGDAPVAGEDETLETGAAHAHHEHVEDDPNAGIPIETVAAPDDAEETR